MEVGNPPKDFKNIQISILIQFNPTLLIFVNRQTESMCIWEF
jgi:hypothetical protein